MAADIFSDSLLLATNSLELLTRVWPALIADRGFRLKRLLKRLLVVGTLELTPHTDLGEEFTGPWLLFLRTSPIHALKTILRLIEFATDRWAEGYKAFTRTAELPAFKILLDGAEKDFVGDGNVIGDAFGDSTRHRKCLQQVNDDLHDQLEKARANEEPLLQELKQQRGILNDIHHYLLPVPKGSEQSTS